MMTRKKKSLVEEGLNSQELPQDVLSNFNSRRFCRQQPWCGTCGLVPGPGRHRDTDTCPRSLRRWTVLRSCACEQDLRAYTWLKIVSGCLACGSTEAQHRGWWLGCGSWGALSGLRCLGGAHWIQSNLWGCPRLRAMVLGWKHRGLQAGCFGSTPCSTSHPPSSSHPRLCRARWPGPGEESPCAPRQGHAR